jgi:8-oxo-dGTP diphosphatase
MNLHAVAVLILSPEGTPLVKDPKKPIPRYWKLPGGRSEGSETPEECAIREIYEELGLRINLDDLYVIEQQDRENHTATFFRIELPSLTELKDVGNEQEEIQVFPSVAGILKLQDLFPNHRTILEKVERMK